MKGEHLRCSQPVSGMPAVRLPALVDGCVPGRNHPLREIAREVIADELRVVDALEERTKRRPFHGQAVQLDERV